MPAMTIVDKKRRSTDGPPRFEETARGIMREVQDAFGKLIASVPGSRTITKAADFQKALGVDPKLGWLVFRVAKAANPLAAGTDVPSRVSMQKLFKAAAKQRVPVKVIEEASGAFSRFEELVTEHAGDRDSFASMVSALAAGTSEEMDLTQRRAAFKANSHIWGMQARTRLFCAIVHPSHDNPLRGDGMGLRGLIDLKRLRSDARAIITRSRASDNDGNVRSPFTREPLDPRGMTELGVTLLTDFSSQPPPRFESIPGADGEVTVEIDSKDIGNRSQVTCLTGDIIRGALSRFRDEHNYCEIVRAIVRVPCEVLVHDVLVHESMYGHRISPSVSVFSNVGGDIKALPREVDRLTMHAPVQYLGRGPDVVECRDVPRYSEMVRYALDRAHWNESEFDVYRCRVEYPVMPSSVVMQWPLPEAPTAAAGGKSAAKSKSEKT